jgi:hypothetical protein
MTSAEPDPGSLTDVELRNEIRLLEIEIAACDAQIDPEIEEAKRSRRLARGTFLTAAGFFGLTLDPLSAVVLLVGFFDGSRRFARMLWPITSASACDGGAMNYKSTSTSSKTRLNGATPPSAGLGER